MQRERAAMCGETVILQHPLPTNPVASVVKGWRDIHRDSIDP